MKSGQCELGGIRTPNLLGRNQVHYPVVLRVQQERKSNNYALKFSLLRHDSIFAEIFLTGAFNHLTFIKNIKREKATSLQKHDKKYEIRIRGATYTPGNDS